MELNELVFKYQLQLLLTFGSYGTERFTSASDLDIAYESFEDLSFEDEQQLLTDLIFYFKQDKIDLVNLKKAGPLLTYEIVCQAKLLYQSDQDRFLKLKLKASARYADTKKLRNARKQWLNEQLRR